MKLLNKTVSAPRAHTENTTANINTKSPFTTKTKLLNWFGERGDEIKKAWIKDWFVRGDYIYIQWSDKTPSHLTPDEPYDGGYFSWKSWYFEYEDFGYFNEMKENKHV